MPSPAERPKSDLSRDQLADQYRKQDEPPISGVLTALALVFFIGSCYGTKHDESVAARQEVTTAQITGLDKEKPTMIDYEFVVAGETYSGRESQRMVEPHGNTPVYYDPENPAIHSLGDDFEVLAAQQRNNRWFSFVALVCLSGILCLTQYLRRQTKA